MNETLYQVLLPLRAGDLSAADVLDRVREVAGAGATPSLAAFYRCLKTGMDRGWLEIAGADTSGRGRPNRIYRLSPAGHRAVEKEARRLRALAALGLGEATAG